MKPTVQAITPELTKALQAGLAQFERKLMEQYDWDHLPQQLGFFTVRHHPETLMPGTTELEFVPLPLPQPWLGELGPGISRRLVAYAQAFRDHTGGQVSLDDHGRPVVGIGSVLEGWGVDPRTKTLLRDSKGRVLPHEQQPGARESRAVSAVLADGACYGQHRVRGAGGKPDDVYPSDPFHISYEGSQEGLPMVAWLLGQGLGVHPMRTPEPPPHLRATGQGRQAAKEKYYNG